MMVLGNDHKILLRGTKKSVDETLDVWTHLTNKKQPTLNKAKKEIYQKGQADLKAGILDETLLRDLVAHRINTNVKEWVADLGGEPVIEMEGVHVQYGDKVALGDWTQKIYNKKKQGLHWRVRRGQRWAILGANGSGKTTLLSMITSDHPQTYAQPVKLFGRSRLPENGVPGISIFELQSRIGHSSPEIHAFFPRQLTIRKALESAFAETFLSKPNLTVERDRDINAILHFWKPELDPNHLSHQIPKVSTKDFPQLTRIDPDTREKKYVPIDDIVDYADDLQFGQLSVAQQRIVLFLRALVTKPDIVILDEAFSGLSATQRDKCLRFLDMGERPNRLHPELDLTPYRFPGLSDQQALLMISHVPEEIPDSVRYYMRLPSDPGAGAEPLDFRFGILQRKTAMRSPETWHAAWSPAAEFEAHARRTWRRQQETLEVQDISEFEWWSI
jgi:ABC-type molybdenum transport system ATPase subunit/photorepair protein PhrA